LLCTYYKFTFIFLGLQIDMGNRSTAAVVDPLDEDAVAFCKKFGFILLPDSGKMFLPMADVAELGL